MSGDQNLQQLVDLQKDLIETLQESKKEHEAELELFQEAIQAARSAFSIFRRKVENRQCTVEEQEILADIEHFDACNELRHSRGAAKYSHTPAGRHWLARLPQHQSTDATASWIGFELPPLSEAKALEAVRECLRAMTLEQQRAALVSAGIYNEDGSLTEIYRTESARDG